MIHPFVLDACTIINLLRIDEEDEFLSKSIKKLDINIDSLVYKEVENNILRNSLSKNQKDYISQQLPSFIQYIIHPEIYESFQNDYYDELCHFSNHTKKKNGELTSSILALYLSRKNGSRLYFYTDDFPAKEQFLPYFSFQQIGTIGDSVDLLLFLYSIHKEFQEKRLLKFLQALASEYNTSLKLFFKEILSKKEFWLSEKKRDFKLRDNLNKIETGVLELNFEYLNEAISFFKENNKLYSSINAIIDKHPNIDKETILTIKIKDTLHRLREYKICKHSL